MRFFLNIVILLLVSGVSLVALSPIIVLSLEIYQDPYVIGIECGVSGNKVIAKAWYRGSLKISDAVLIASIGNTTLGSSRVQEISRDRNITLEVVVPENLRGEGDLVISLSIKVSDLYNANATIKGCGL